jgi:lipopolysaccharide exporter
MMFSNPLKSEFARHVVGLSLTTAFAQILPFLAMPILQRWFFSPAEFGIYSTFVSVASVWIAVASFKYEFAIVIAKEEAERIRLLGLALCFTALTAILILVLGLIPNSFFNNLQGLPNSYWYTLLLALSVIGFAGTQILNYWLNYAKKFKSIGFAKIVQSSTGESSKIISGILKFNQFGLIGGRAIGQLFSLTWLSVKVYPEIKGKIASELTFDKLKGVAIRFKEYFLFSTPSAVVGTFSNNLHILIPVQFYPNHIIGIIGAAYAYLAVPAGIISGSFSQVFYKKISEIEDRSVLLNFYKKFGFRLFISGLPFAIALQFIPNEWLTFILGSSWEGFMIYAKMMIWYILIWFVSSSMSFIYIRLKAQKKMLILDISRAALNAGALIIGHNLYHDPVVTISFFVVAQIISYGIAILAAIYFIKTSKLLN